MSWTAVVPLKAAAARKSRLAGVLDAADRIALSERMLARVHAAIVDAGVAPLLLAPAPYDGWACVADDGRDLNLQLAAARRGGGFMVLHADLPLVTAADIDALVAAAAGNEVAIAPDRHGSGTNAVALATDRPFVFAFGPGSFARHRAAAGTHAICDRLGLRLDVDTPEDLALALGCGFGDAARSGVWQGS